VRGPPGDARVRRQAPVRLHRDWRAGRRHRRDRGIARRVSEGEPPRQGSQQVPIDRVKRSDASHGLSRRTLTEPGGDNAMRWYRQELARTSDASHAPALRRFTSACWTSGETHCWRSAWTKRRRQSRRRAKPVSTAAARVFDGRQLAKSRETVQRCDGSARPKSIHAPRRQNAGGEWCRSILESSRGTHESRRLIDPDRDNARTMSRRPAKSIRTATATQAAKKLSRWLCWRKARGP